MAAEAAPLVAPGAAETVARVAIGRRGLLLNVYRQRLRREDLEDCYSQATLELLARCKRGASFQSAGHISNALEQKFVSRINDRSRALAGRSPSESALAAALPLDADSGQLLELADHRAAVDEHVIRRHDLARLREVAAELSEDQRLVVACQVGLGMECNEFCARYGWTPEKFRKVAQRARARLRTLTGEYHAGARCRDLKEAIEAYAAGVADAADRRRVTEHLRNCTACARSVRELEHAGRELAVVIAPATGAAATAAAAGGGAVVLGTGGSLMGAVGLKLGLAAAFCVAGMGGYAVCARTVFAPGGHAHGARPAHRRIHRATADVTAFASVSAATARRAGARGAGAAVRHAPAPAPRRELAVSQARREFGGDPSATAHDTSRAPRAAATAAGFETAAQRAQLHHAGGAAPAAREFGSGP